MEFLSSSLPHFNKRQHRISEWLAKLEQSFILVEVEEDERKIKFRQVFTGQTGEDILAQLPDDASWEEAKRELIERLGDGTVEEEAWTALKQLEQGDKDITDLGAEAAKLAKKAYPEQEETANQQTVEAFVYALDPKFALEMQKLGHRALDNVIARARLIERLQKDYPSPNMNNLVVRSSKETESPQPPPQTKPCELHSPLQPQQSLLTQQQADTLPQPQVYTLLLVGAGVSCATRRAISLLPVLSGKNFPICAAAGWLSQCSPKSAHITTHPTAEGVADEDGSVSLN